MIIDLAIVFTYFVIIISVGLFLGRKEDDLLDFSLGGRNMPWWAVMGSIIAAETSAGTFIGTPGEGFALRNYAYLQLMLGTVLARVIIGFTFLKPYYRYNVYSIYEFLETRFGSVSRRLASATFLVTRVLASGTRLYISAVILVLGYKLLNPVEFGPTRELLIYVSAITVLTALTAVYTTLGGIKAVIWTDLIQATIMIGSGLAAIMVLIGRIPMGWTGVQALLGPKPLFFFTGLKHELSFWENVKAVLFSDYTIFGALIGYTFTTLATHGTDQDMVQRMLTARDHRKSRLSLLLSGLADIPIAFIFLTIGILLWVFYRVNPDPGLPVKTNEVFCHFILTQMPVGVRGLMIAGIFATAMGSLSAALNALATSFVRDWCAKPTLHAARMATVGFAFSMIVVASLTSYLVILSPQSRMIPIALGAFGYTYGSLLGVFLLGVLTRSRGSDRGNVIAMSCGFITVAILSGLPNEVVRHFGFQFYPQPGWLPVVSFVWRVFFGAVVTFAVGACFRTPKPGRDSALLNNQ